MAHPHAVPVAMWSPVGEALASRAPGGDLRGSLFTGVGPAPMPRSRGGDLLAGCRGLGGVGGACIRRSGKDTHGNWSEGEEQEYAEGKSMKSGRGEDPGQH